MIACLVIDSIHTTSPSPVGRPAPQESTNSAEVPFVTEEVSLLQAFTPELDGERQGVDGLLVATDEGTTEVYALQVVLLGL